MESGIAVCKTPQHLIQEHKMRVANDEGKLQQSTADDRMPPENFKLQVGHSSSCKCFDGAMEKGFFSLPFYFLPVVLVSTADLFFDLPSSNFNYIPYHGPDGGICVL